MVSQEIINKYFQQVYVRKNSEREDWDHLLDLIKSDFFQKENYDLMSLSLNKLRKIANNWLYLQNLEKIKSESELHDFELIYQFENNYRWVLLKSELSYKNEGNLMENCVASYFDRHSRIYSLRNSEGIPKLTLEYNPNNKKIVQVKRRKNSTIDYHKKYANYLAIIFNQLNVHVLDNSPEYYSLFLENNKYNVIVDTSDVIAHNFRFHKNIGYFNSIQCNEFIIEEQDISFLSSAKIAANELIIISEKNDFADEIPEIWNCKKITVGNIYSGSRHAAGIILGDLHYPGSPGSFFVGAMGMGKSNFVRQMMTTYLLTNLECNLDERKILFDGENSTYLNLVGFKELNRSRDSKKMLEQESLSKINISMETPFSNAYNSLSSKNPLFNKHVLANNGASVNNWAKSCPIVFDKKQKDKNIFIENKIKILNKER